MKTEDLYVIQASNSSGIHSMTGSADAGSFKTEIGMNSNEKISPSDVLFPVNLVLIVFLLIALCYGFYRREKWGVKN